jgi:hypothetical protein
MSGRLRGALREIVARQIDLICAPQLMSAERPMVAQNGGYGSQELCAMPLTVRGTDSCVIGGGSPTALGDVDDLVAAVGGLIT